MLLAVVTWLRVRQGEEMIRRLKALEDAQKKSTTMYEISTNVYEIQWQKNTKTYGVQWTN